ncbi:hypothetical protein Rhal01_02956 [Rubritalea halochordaticola]|uniref:VWFA domain-containing protein n=1 Tax=Rubritalea halochordaticola TaxID=714537 RepID=A0ABP9V276_9BACT
MHFSSLHYLWWILPIIAILGAIYAFSLVDRPKIRKISALTARLLGILLILLALCRPFMKSSTDDLHVVFLLDGSASVSVDGMESALGKIEESISNLGATDSYDLYLYADEPRRVSPEEAKDFIAECRAHGGEAEFRSASKLSSAIIKTRLRFPADKTKRLVIYSDGVPTDSQLEKELANLQQEGIEPHFNRLPGLNVAEASVTSFRALVPVAFEGEIVRMRAEIASSKDMNCIVRLLNRGVSVQQREIKLTKGKENNIGFDVAMNITGATSWTLEIIPENDHFPANNQVSTTVQVSGKPRVLVIHQNPREMRPFSRAMNKQGIELDIRGARGLPQNLQELLSFKAIILADVPATELTVEQMTNLKRYVGDFGGGLAMLGSENSFGIGGYYNTPIDEILPLVSRYEKEKQKPSLAMVLVIDKSGSMDGAPIQLARQASKSAVDLMGIQDSIAVIGFDSDSKVIVPMTSVSAKGSVIDAIDTLTAGGGTNLYPAMLSAKEMLETSPAKVKHMIILSDGQTMDADYLGMASEMASQRITISTVALGDGAAKELMAAISQEGKGRYYETTDPSNMPQIFTKETMQASRSAIKEDVFSSIFMSDHPLANGFEGAEFPFVMGYVMTKPRPTATVVLAAETGDPLLAVSRYGLGTTLSYASDLTEKWGSEWLSWDACSKFWNQAIRAVLRKEDGQGISIRQEDANNLWNLNIRRNDEGGKAIDNVKWRATALNQDGKSIPVSIEQSGIGTYAANLDLTGSDKIALQVQDTADGHSKTLYWQRAYPAEYQLDSELNKLLAQSPSIDPGSIRANLTKDSVDSDSQPLFVFFGIGLLITGIALRRI